MAAFSLVISIAVAISSAILLFCEMRDGERAGVLSAGEYETAFGLEGRPQDNSGILTTIAKVLLVIFVANVIFFCAVGNIEAASAACSSLSLVLLLCSLSVRIGKQHSRRTFFAAVAILAITLLAFTYAVLFL